ncbi:hypothetical protein JZ751_025489 [Albula glossodonta]|uniref:Uncharacterized protein n=1 Tax=Albula glossodonta TaxID=121402 RepID=A0A8T2NI73_9TELE|nr:hypothetical protein JZ751_025489 [Albula glossodonta]
MHLDEIAELECCVAELKGDRAELEAQMQEQCGDYEELLSEKMALDIEITAYSVQTDAPVPRLPSDSVWMSGGQPSRPAAHLEPLSPNPRTPELIMRLW